MNEVLLQRIDETEEARHEGRSAVLRRAVVESLRRRERDAINAAYRRGYTGGKGLGDEFAGWSGGSR